MVIPGLVWDDEKDHEKHICKKRFCRKRTRGFGICKDPELEGSYYSYCSAHKCAEHHCDELKYSKYKSDFCKYHRCQKPKCKERKNDKLKGLCSRHHTCEYEDCTIHTTDAYCNVHKCHDYEPKMEKSEPEMEKDKTTYTNCIVIDAHQSGVGE